jgi:lipoate---protein ligase
MDYRLLDTGKQSAAMNMAIDEAIIMSKTATLRFYGWEPPAITLGYFQSAEKEVDLERCAEEGIDVIRRLTGGGAVFHDKEITYSFIVPEDSREVSKNILESYGQICGFVIAGLKKLGIGAEFKPINDIVVGGRKISGNAQTRRGRMLLQHGTILLDVDVARMFSLLKVPDEKIRDKMISAVEERVTSLRALLGREVGFDEAKFAIASAFKESGRGLKASELTEDERKTAKKLLSKYSGNDWNHMR